MSSTDLTIDRLERRVQFGAQWRIAQLTDQQTVVDLCACTGELVERVQSNDPALLAYLRVRRRTEDSW
jgi:hypothetical protein